MVQIVHSIKYIVTQIHILFVKGTVRPDYIGLKGVPLDRPWESSTILASVLIFYYNSNSKPLNTKILIIL
jgi:hypothetical protein